MPDIDYTTEGTLFDGRLEVRVVQGYNQGLEDIADKGKDDILVRFGEVLRTHPTGHLEASQRVHKHGDDFLVDDGGVVYGPWIEGVGSRNRTTRFKGYATYRRVRDELQAKCGGVMSRALKKWMEGS